MRYLPAVFLISLLVVLSFPLSHSSTPQQYSVTFIEQGLPAGMNWSVSQGGKTIWSTGNIVFLEQNGSYTFKVNPIPGYSASKYIYEVNVSGRNVTETVYWSALYYKVTFIESGLSSGTPWNVSVNSELKTSVSNYIIFYLPNGSYSFVIPTVNGAIPSPSSGTFSVNGFPIAILVSYKVIVNITFLVTGLPSNEKWGVSINNTTYYSTSPFIYVNIENGSYTYRIIMPSNYYSSPSSGKVSGNEFVFVNAYSYLPWEILIVFIIVVTDVFLALRIMRTRASLRKDMKK